MFSKFIFIFLFIPFSYALTISEIDFGSIEFVEIIKNENDTFNSSHFYIIDQTVNNNNTFSLLQQHNTSNTILIVGSKFLDEYDITHLNCSIYQTSGSQVGYGGMSSSTESFTIQFNKNLFANFTKSQSESFENYESYHYNFNTQSFQIYNKSICDISTFAFNESLIVINSSENNSQNSTSINSTSSCILEINVDKTISAEKITFTHKGNYSLGVEYYIEDGVSNIVRSKTTSSTSSTKTYTPKKNGKFIIKSSIQTNECSISNQSEVYFYNSNLDEDNEESSINVNKDTEIEISQVILNGLDMVNIHFSASRGDSSKYRLKILVDDEEYTEFDFKKYSEVEFILPIKLQPGEHEIEIEGFGINEKIDITMPDIISEIRDELIILTQEKGIDFSNSNSNYPQEIIISSEEIEEIINSRINEMDISSPNAKPIETLQPSISIEDQLFSKHFFSQNIGIVIICFAILVVAGVSIALR